MRCERCGISCMDAEDYRDHLPCPGSVKERQAARIKALEAERDRLKETIKDAIAVLNTVECEAWEKNTITYGTATRVKSVMQDCREIIGGEGK